MVEIFVLWGFTANSSDVSATPIMVRTFFTSLISLGLKHRSKAGLSVVAAIRAFWRRSGRSNVSALMRRGSVKQS